MSNVLIDREKIDILANAISDKSGVPVAMTLDEMVEAVDGIKTGGGEPNLQVKTYTVNSAGTATVTADSGYDGLSSVAVSVPSAISVDNGTGYQFINSNGRKWRVRTWEDYDDGGYISGVQNSHWQVFAAVASGTSVTPTESSQTIGGANYMMEGAVTVNPIPSQYIVPSGTKTITENGSNIDVTSYANVDVSVSGATSSTIKTGEGTPATGANQYVGFSNILGEPTSFVLISTEDISINAEYPLVSSVVFDGTNCIGQIVTNTTNAQVSYTSTEFSYQYTNNTLFISSTEAVFNSYDSYDLVYTYDGSSNDIQTLDVQVGSGATSITFTGLEDEPIYWSCIFKSNFGTSSGYQRVMAILNYDIIGGLSMDSAARFSGNWTASYNNGSLTITSQGTNAGGYYHQPGYYQLTYAYDSGGNYQSKTVTPTTSQQVITADTGYEALKRVTVNAMPTGTAGTPTATKGSRVGNSITVTPTVTNTAGYIAGGTLTGTGVSVSASEVTNGTYSITADGTYNIANYASVSVNVGGGGDTPEPSNINVGTATRTLTSAASSISFTGLSGEPTSFAVCTSAGLSTGASPWKTAMVVYDGSMVQGDFITNTSNQQLATSTSTTYSSITFGKSYSNGTLTITGSGSNFQANEYTLVYTYNGSTSDVQTKTQTVGSGATSITFSGLSGTPKYFACIFEGTAGYYSTSSGYQRVIGVVYNGTSTYGVSMGSGAVASTTAWTYTYNNGSLTITSAGTNNGGYFHQATNVNYKLIYVV